MIGIPVIWNSAQFSGGGASFSFTTFQTDFGTYPVADSSSDTITFTSSDNILSITGDSSTDGIDITAGSALPTYLVGAGIYMFSGTNSDIAGYESAPYLGLFTAGAPASASNTVTTTPTLLEEFATDLGYPNVTAIPIGLASFHYETQKSAGSNNYYSYVELYKRTSGGTETLLGISDYSSQTAVNTVVQVTVTLYIASPLSLGATDRLVAKVYAVMVSSSATIFVRYDDTTNARMQIPMLSGGTNTGDVSLAVVGSSPNLYGASMTGQILNLEPAAYGYPGVIDTTAQTLSGSKTFMTHALGSPNVILKETASQTADLMAMQNSSGTQVGAINVYGNFCAPTASGADNGFQFYGDPDTGFSQSTANSISCYIAGNEIWRLGVSNSGFFNFGSFPTSTISAFTINSIGSNTPTFALRLVNGQSVDLMQLYTYSVGGGTEFANITKEGYIQFVDGNATTPGYSWYNDTNTGFYRVTADEIGISLGGTQRADFRGNYISFHNDMSQTNAALQVPTLSTTIPNLSLKGIASQTANYIDLRNSSNTIVGSITVDPYIRLAAGSVTTPAFAFNSPTNYGMYLDGSSICFTLSSSKKFEISREGNLRAFSLHDNAVSNGNASNQDIRSGASFTPTFSNTTNCDPVASKVNWLRVGNVVTVSVYGTCTTTSANFSFEMDLPVASNFTSDYKAAGTGMILVADKETANFIIYAEVTNNTIFCEGYDVNSGIGDTRMSFHFTYEVE